MEVTPTESTLPLLQEDMKHRSSEEKHTTPDMGLLESSTQAEIDDIREENGKLKSFLARIMKDYHSLQTQFFDMNYKPVQESKAPVGDQSTSADEDEDAEKSVLSLSLGLMNNQTLNLEKEDEESEIKDHGQLKGALALGLKSKFEGSGIRRDGNSSNASTGEDSSVEQKNEEEVGEPWPPRSKAARKFGSRETTHDEVSQDSRQPPAKRARVCVRVRCDAPTMNDGCQWRKYGQKISKGNPCPRAYYRCTVAPTCPVRKQVQRCAEDLSILIISYEGIHNHPLPLAARAMASTTTAAASMLMSGASSSITSASPGGASSNTSSITMSAGLHGTNYFTFSDVISAPRQYTSTSHPSITLDFTGTATPPNSGGTQFKLPPGFVLNSRNSTSFNLASNPSESSATPFTSWNNGCSSYGPLPCIQNTKSNNMITSLSLGLRARQSQAANFSIASSLPKATSSQTIPSQRQQLLTDTIAKMITADPSFQSAVAAAITSYIGGGSREVPQGAVGHSGHELQRRDQLSASDEEIFDKISGAARASGFLTTSNSSYSNSKY